MRRARPTLALLSLLLGLAVPQATAGPPCDLCDCIHLPCKTECKPCCGLSKGVIISRKGNRFALKSGDNILDFRITGNTNIEGDIEEGHQATVFFRKSGANNLAQQVIVPDSTK